MIRQIAENVGKGLVSGFAGTAAMTLSSTIEMKLRGRSASDAPAEAASRVLGIETIDDASRQRLSNIVHWSYGTSWGAARGLAATAGLSGAGASVAHFSAVWSAALLMLPRLDVAPPVRKWGMTELLVDAFHHAVYAAATGICYDWMDRR